MRVPKISLVNGLHAQNKHDLCRTISIQNDIDKLNTFQLTQFHLWWCQVCRAWEFSLEDFIMRERIESKHVTKEIKSQMPVISPEIIKERGYYETITFG